MNAEQLFTYFVLGAGVIALAVQYGIAVGWKRREERIEKQRGREVKFLLEWINTAWSTAPFHPTTRSKSE